MNEWKMVHSYHEIKYNKKNVWLNQIITSTYCKYNVRDVFITLFTCTYVVYYKLYVCVCLLFA